MNKIIINIVDKKTQKEVLKQYTNREIRLHECKIEVGKQLLIRYELGSYFKHEKVLSTRTEDDNLIVETVSKIWTIGKKQ